MFERKEDSCASDLAAILSSPRNREEFLGVAPVNFPSKDEILNTSRRIAAYSQSDGYKVFADEIWARIVNHIDKILDDKTPSDKLQHYIGAVKAEMDMLRVSYQARDVVTEEDKLSVTSKR